MKKNNHIIDQVEPDSIAQELGLEPGDILLSVNGMPVEDVFDYRYLISEEKVVLLIRKGSESAEDPGEEWELEIEKDAGEDLGIRFENGLMDDYRSCANRCIFCFIDQMPPGMRETLYFKDDDTRLSFLQGNYVTLTNMKDKDIGRIIRYRLSPINISIHTTNPDLRCRMLENRFAGDILRKIGRLYEAGIAMNGQIVLCKGINDGEELERSIRDLIRYAPCLESVSVVPVGLTKYRDGLYPLEPFGEADARQVIAQIEKWQRCCMEHYGMHLFHASDEWYLLAKQPLPEEERYDGYPQLENGVGMIRLLITEFYEALAEYSDPEQKARIRALIDANGGTGGKHRFTVAGKDEPGQKHRLTVASGALAAPFLKELADAFENEFPEYEVEVVAVRNDFFGEQITVSGLVTAQDLTAQLKGRNLGERLAVPCNMLRMGERVFLDDWTVEEVENALQVPVTIVKSSGQDLLDALLGLSDAGADFSKGKEDE